MGLFNSRNLRKAKDLLDKNRHKVGDIVDKAGDQLDKVSKGKTSNVTSKATEAAKKYSEGGVSHYGREVPVDQQVASQQMAHGTASQAQVNAAGVAAANAITAAANAATNLMNNAAVQAQIAQAQQAAANGEPVDATHDPSVYGDGGTGGHDGDDTSSG